MFWGTIQSIATLCNSVSGLMKPVPFATNVNIYSYLMLKRAKSFLLENRTTKQTVAKNTFWLFFGTISSRLIKAGIIIYAARVLGAADWGAFSYALSLAAFFTVFTDFGISTVITRESAKDLSVQETYFSTSIIIKLVMTALSIIAFIALSPFIVKQKEVLALLPIVILLVSLDGMRDFAASLSRAWEKMEVEAFIQIFTNIAIVIGGFIALYATRTSYALSVGYTIGVGIGMLAAFWPFRRYFKNLGKTFTPKLIKPILAASWPIGMLGLMTATMLNTDTVMIGWFRSIADVGYYAAAQRIMQIVFLIPGLLTTALFPSMMKFIDQREKFESIIGRMIAILALVAIPMTIGGVLLAKDIMHIVYGNAYLAGASSFVVMSLVFLPGFISPLLGNALFALSKERKLIAYVLLGIAGNAIFNLLFIPVFGIVGGALSTLVNQTIITCYLYYKLKKEIDISIKGRFTGILIASIVLLMAVVLMSLVHLNSILTIIAGAVIYISILATLKEPAFMELAGPAMCRLKSTS